MSNPEISKAYYGRLSAVPARYEIVSRRPFALYAQITVPDTRGALRDYRLTILGPGGQRLAQLSTPSRHWKRFFEPFGGDHYLTGPEYRRHVPAGHYIVQVTRPTNRATYVLAIGEAEQWGPIETLSALIALPTIKHDYFHESVLQAWLTRTVPAIAVLVAFILLALWLLNKLIRRLAQHRQATRKGHITVSSVPRVADWPAVACEARGAARPTRRSGTEATARGTQPLRKGAGRWGVRSWRP